jgi:hypothetical protein
MSVWGAAGAETDDRHEGQQQAQRETHGEHRDGQRPDQEATATTGLGPNRSATRDPISAPITAPPFRTSRNANDPFASNPARRMSSGSQVFNE